MTIANAYKLENLEVKNLLERANEALQLLTGRNLSTEDECLRVELAQRYVNLALSLRSNQTVRP